MRVPKYSKVDNMVRRFIIHEIHTAIRNEILREYSDILDEQELKNKYYDIIGLVTVALENT